MSSSRSPSTRSRAGVKFSYNFTRDLIFDRKGGLKGWLLNNSPESGLLDGHRPSSGSTAPPKSPTPSSTARATSPAARCGRSISSNGRGSSGRVATGMGLGARIWTGDPRGPRSTAATPRSLLPGARPGARGAGGRSRPLKDEDRVGLLGYSDPEDTVYWWEEDGERGAPRIRKISLVRRRGHPGRPRPRTRGWSTSTFDPFNGHAVAIGSVDGPGPLTKWLDAKLGGRRTPPFRALQGQGGRAARAGRPTAPSSSSASPLRDAGELVPLRPGRARKSPRSARSIPSSRTPALGKKTFFTYAARDGLSIPAYLHMPPATAGKDLPLIVLPHGGPERRATTASSTGGPSSSPAAATPCCSPSSAARPASATTCARPASQEWGGKMQTDLVDGINDLADEGVDRPEARLHRRRQLRRLCGASRHDRLPDAYRCGVSVNGVADPGPVRGRSEGRRFGN